VAAKINNSYPDPDWNDQLIARLLIREATTLVEDNAAR
jgi:hypothetical protein